MYIILSFPILFCKSKILVNYLKDIHTCKFSLAFKIEKCITSVCVNFLIFMVHGQWPVWKWTPGKIIASLLCFYLVTVYWRVLKYVSCVLLIVLIIIFIQCLEITFALKISKLVLIWSTSFCFVPGETSLSHLIYLTIAELMKKSPVI